MTTHSKQSAWPGYWTWANYQLIAPDGLTICSGAVRLTHLHLLTAMFFASQCGDGE